MDKYINSIADPKPDDHAGAQRNEKQTVVHISLSVPNPADESVKYSFIRATDRTAIDTS